MYLPGVSTHLEVSMAEALKVIPKRGNLASSRCPAREIMDSTTGLWGYLIMRNLIKDEVLRFAEFKSRIDGISEKMLSQTLKRLERSGFIERKSFPEVPPRVEYRLTKLGRGYADIAGEICEYVEANIRKIIKSQEDYDQKDNSRPWQKARR